MDRARQALSRQCEAKNKTMIAMLGTAMLAKATDLRVDVFSLKVGGKKKTAAYSARALCKNVLAADANRLGIDLGVTGPEPLNNQPFFGKARVGRDMHVRSDAKKALSVLIDALEALDKVRTEKEARSALRAFLQVRHRKPTLIELEEGEGDNLEERDLLALINEFVQSDSESGRRAQAVAAGLLDVMHGADRVRVSRVHDPSRHFPGDIAVLEPGSAKAVERVFEVRDKPVTREDLHNLVDRAGSNRISKVAMLAVASQQAAFDQRDTVRRAEARQVRLRVYFGWAELVREALFWAPVPGVPVGPAYRAISRRLADLEVSETGRDHWRAASTQGS